MNTGFPCTSCGACCKNIGGIKELESFDRGDGVCRYLDMQTHLCAIYHHRPEICKIDDMYDKHYAKHYTKDHFYAINIEACKRLQEKEGVGMALRLK